MAPSSKEAPQHSALQNHFKGDPLLPGESTNATNDTARVRSLAFGEGFNMAGIASPGPHPEHARMQDFVDRGYAGTMSYLVNRAQERMNPKLVADWVKSVIVLGLFYETPHPHTQDAIENDDTLWISRYAWGRDYHRVITKMNRRLMKKLFEAFGNETKVRHWVDTGPVMEKVMGKYGGLGWIGKNTMLIHPRAGSWFFLSVLFTDLDLVHDHELADQCGSCTRCLDVCPTDAFPEPYVLDATKCISYRTIETKEDELPSDQGDGLAPHLLGCDLCQDVCPYNRFSPMTILNDFQPREPGFAPTRADIESLLNRPDEGLSRMVGTPLKRPGPEGLSRTLRWHDEARSRQESEEP